MTDTSLSMRCQMMTRVLFLALIMVLMTPPVTSLAQLPNPQAPEYKWHWLERPLTYIVPSTDLAITRIGITRGCEEVNTLAGQNIGQQIILLVVGAVVTDLSSHYLMRQGHTKKARFIRWLDIGVSAGSTVRNITILDQCSF
jgi:hypothetical protein